MGDQPKTADEDTQPPPTPAPSAGRTRNTLIASGAGLALVGGLVGFGIGHATADNGDGDRFGRVSQYAPGEGRPGLGDQDRPDRPADGERRRHHHTGEAEQPSSQS